MAKNKFALFVYLVIGSFLCFRRNSTEQKRDEASMWWKGLKLCKYYWYIETKFDIFDLQNDWIFASHVKKRAQ